MPMAEKSAFFMNSHSCRYEPSRFVVAEARACGERRVADGFLQGHARAVAEATDIGLLNLEVAQQRGDVVLNVAKATCPAA